MSYVLAILALIAFGLALPVCAVACVVWLFGDTWNWRHLSLSIPIVLACVNAPAYSAAATGLLTWNSAFAMHVFAIVLFGIATAINGGNPTEGYALALVILTLSVSISVVRRAWRDDNDVQDATVTEAAENNEMHARTGVAVSGLLACRSPVPRDF
ncbi:hypothetical protein [Roseiconus lacunae]|uniref:Uncharacterized protein n=1 Tax=Roseiconus lacunae TaxID=2605694 RepID=A0ABT7PSX1_9BACT|nr:hypothetical protein [Roseiconus lacunae]MCD0462000.1 hypothetical protein [Roseiconus lacunae]MDM4019550.1 hypothetical protein [Roseiconus lacunae]